MYDRIPDSGGATPRRARSNNLAEKAYALAVALAQRVRRLNERVTGLSLIDIPAMTCLC